MNRPAALREPRRSRAGLLLALVALAVQMAAASIVLPLAAPAAMVERMVAASICHPAHEPANRPAPLQAVCPLSQAVAQAGMMLAAPAVIVAAPVAVAWRPALPPPARAPPAVSLASAYPRGPPALI